MIGKARVVAQIHPFRPERKEWTVHAGASLARLVRKLQIPKECIAVIQINGRPIKADDFGSTRVAEGDLVNMRVVPANKQAANMVGGLGLGAGAAALLWLFSRSSTETSATGQAIENNSFTPPPDPRPEPPVVTGGNGGPAEALIPQVMGLGNKTNQLGVWPRLYGTMFCQPFVVGTPYVVLEGNDQYLYFALSLGYGELDITELKLGDKLFSEYPAGTITYAVRYGTAGDLPLSIYTNDVDELSVNEALPNFVYKQYRATQEADKLAVDIQFPDGCYGEDTSGNRYVCLVGIHTEYRLVGDTGAWTGVNTSPASAGNWVLAENTTQPIRRNLTWPVTRGLYDVRLRWHTSTAPSGGFAVSSPNLLTVRAIKNEAPVNPIIDANGTAIPMTFIEGKIKASESTNGQLDTISCIGKSKLRHWNGTTFDAAAISSDPADVFLDMLTGTAFNKQFTTDILNLEALLALSTYATLKGFSFNHIYDTPITIQTALRDVLSSCNSSVAAPDGLLQPLIDKERTTVVQMFTQSNSWNFQGELIIPVIPHGLRVEFINPDADWTVDIYTVYDDGYSSSNARNFEPFQTVGVTNFNQAYKLARRQLAVARLRPRRMAISCDQKHLVCNRGDLVELNYDTNFSGLSSAVILAVTTNGGGDVTAIRVDNTFTMVGGSTYGVQIQLSDGTFETRQVTTLAGDNYTVTFATPIPAATDPLPAVGDDVAFGFLGQTTIKCLIDSIEHERDGSARITMVDYSSGVYGADTGTIPAYDPQISYQRPGLVVINPPVIDNIASDETVLREETDGALTTGIQVGLAPPTSLGVRFVQWRFREQTETAWSTVFQGDADSGGTVIFITGVQDGMYYDLNIRYQDIAGRNSIWTERDDYLVIGKTTLPPDVPQVLRSSDQQKVEFPYDATVGITVPRDYAGIQVRCHNGENITWDTAVIIENLFGGSELPLSRFPVGTFTVLVKAVDIAGNMSTNATYAIINAGDYIPDNLILTISESPDFTGTKTACAVDGGILKADETAALFWSGTDTNPFWSGVDTNLMYGTSYASMTYQFSYTPSYDVKQPFSLALDYTISGESYFNYYRTLGNQQFWNPVFGADANPHWTSDAALYWSGDPPWTLFPGSIVGNPQTYQFKTEIAGSTQQRGQIDDLATLVDVPDITELINDFVIEIGGTRLVLTETYDVIDHVGHSLQETALYPDAVRIVTVDKSISGPLLKAYDATNTECQALIDATVKGH